MASEPTGIAVLQEGGLERRGPQGLLKGARWLTKRPLAAFGLALVLGLVVMAFTAQVFATHDPRDLEADGNLGISREHFLGTDPVGKDIYSLLLYGSRVSLAVGIGAVLVGVSAGAILGLTSGFLGGPVDLFGQRFIDAMVAFPTIIKALVLMAILGPGPENVVIALGVGFLPHATRIVRSVVLRERARDYALAARALGASTVRIMFRHVLPNSFAPYLVLVSVSIGGAIVSEASLSFLGAGVGPHVPSWGMMLGSAAQSFFDASPTLAWAPGLIISLAVLGFNLLGDGIRDSLDPRLRS